MGLTKLFVDTTRKKLVQSATNAGDFTLPKLVYQDTMSLEVCLLEANPAGTQSTPFTVVDTAPYSLKIAIGPRPGIPYAIQDTWTKTTGSGAKFSGYLDLGQTNMGTALGSMPSVGGVFEIELNSLAGGNETMYQAEVVVWNQVIDSGASGAPTPTDDYNTKAEDAALFVAFDNAPGLTIKLRSPDGLWVLELGVDNNGSFTTESTAVPP